MKFVYDETIWNIVIQTFTGAQFLPCCVIQSKPARLSAKILELQEETHENFF